jgi:hypothetical protein
MRRQVDTFWHGHGCPVSNIGIYSGSSAIATINPLGINDSGPIVEGTLADG